MASAGLVFLIAFSLATAGVNDGSAAYNSPSKSSQANFTSSINTTKQFAPIGNATAVSNGVDSNNDSDSGINFLTEWLNRPGNINTRELHREIDNSAGVTFSNVTSRCVTRTNVSDDVINETSTLQPPNCTTELVIEDMFHCNLEERCVRKCCAENDTLEVPLREWFGCAEATAEELQGGPWAPPPSAFAPGPPPRLLPDASPSCGRGDLLVVLNHLPEDTFSPLSILANGSLHIAGAATLAPHLFCVERSRLHDGSVVANAVFCVSASEPSTRPSFLKQLLYASLLATGALFLLLALCVYALVPDLGRKTHARALVAHCAALLAAFVALVPLQFHAFALGGGLCYLAAFVVQFSMLAAFFWLNVLCIDIAWAFRELQHPGGEGRPRRRRLLLAYQLYAWGGAALLTAATAALDLAAPPSLLPALPRPHIGVTRCWFHGREATLLYYYGPMSVLLAVNVVLFTYTAVLLGVELKRRKQLQAMQASTGARGPRGGSLDTYRDRTALYARLVLLMGVSWATEVASWAEGSGSALWVVTDALNALRGLCIFLLFCCKRRLLRRLRARLCADAAARARRSSSSQSHTLSASARASLSHTQPTLQANTQLSMQATTHANMHAMGELAGTARLSR